MGKLKFLLFFLFSFLVAAQQKAWDFTIVLPENPTQLQKYAAEYLTSSLSERINPSKISTERVSNSGRKIYLGSTKFSSKYTVKNPDEILIARCGDDFIVKGNGANGTLYATQDFVENLGTDGNNYKPTDCRVIKQYTPPFKSRSFFSDLVSDAKTASSLRLNGDLVKLQAPFGKPNEIVGFAHTFSQIIPVEVYFKTHPEWFSDPENGNLPCTTASRQPEPQATQLDLTNPALVAEFKKNILKRVSEFPESSVFSVSINDNANFCKTKRSEEIIRKEGNYYGVIIPFINDIAKTVNATYPGKLIETLVYAGDVNLPKYARPADNVLIRMALITYDAGLPITHPKNAEKKRIIDSWMAVSKNFYYWDYIYNTLHSNMLMPQPGFLRLGEDLKYLADNGCDGVFLEFSSTKNLGFFPEMKAEIASKLLWNPQLNIKDLIHEYCLKNYGVSAGEMEAYFYQIENAFLKKNMQLPTHHNEYSYLTLKDLTASQKYFDNAYAKIGADKILKSKIDNLKISLDNAWLYLYNQMSVEKSRSNSNVILPQAEELKNRLINQTKNIQPLYGFIKEKLEKTDTFAKTGTTTDVIIEENEFDLVKNSPVVGLVEDKNAKNGKAAIMKSGASFWGVIVYFSPYSKFIFGKPSEVKVRLKVIPKTGREGFIHYGIYNFKAKENKTFSRYATNSLEQDKYIELPVGKVQLENEDELYFTVDDNVEALYIDQVIVK